MVAIERHRVTLGLTAWAMHLETFHSFHPRVRSVAPPLPPLHWQTAAVLYVFNLFLFVAGIADAVFLKIDLLARL